MDIATLPALNFAALAEEAAAMSDAVLSNDLQEARFRAQLLAAKADLAVFGRLAMAAATLLTALGPPGTTPTTGYGADILKVADELDAIESNIR